MTVAGNGHMLSKPQSIQDIFCLEYHNYSGGAPEINIVTPNGIGVSIPAEFLTILRKSLDTLSLVLAGTEKGHTTFLSVDSEGRIDIETRGRG